MDKSEPLDVAIVGGGIAGLYCAYQLHTLAPGVSFALYERSDHLGGRIWSARYENGKYDPKSTFKSDPSEPEFCAEFGPMRIELDHQELLSILLTGHGRHAPALEGQKGLGFDEESDFIPFPAYASPAASHEAKYELTPAEAKEATPLDLLRLAIVRILGLIIVPETADAPRYRLSPVDVDEVRVDNWDSTELERARTLEDHLSDLSRRIATWPEESTQAFRRWARQLSEADYQNIREFARFDDGSANGTPLWRMGFWNLLSEVLSHAAVLKIRDLGTFYHLLPDNPNAVEWLIFWLRGFKSSDSLVAIKGGMQRITAEMESRIREYRENRIHLHHVLRELRLDKDAKGNDVVAVTSDRVDEDGKTLESKCVHARHVVLALPTAPLDKLAGGFEDIDNRSFHYWLDAAFGFPLLKLFVVVKRRWWREEDDSAQTNLYATRVPAREMHYRSGRGKSKSEKGMILLYTDRPASSFWANYVRESGPQEAPEWGKPADNRRLISRFVRYINELAHEYSGDHPKPSRLESFSMNDVDSYGIRDWGREPYNGAAHAWRPERKSWEVLERLSAAQLRGSNARNVHVCGEAYSDYHGFMEGSLRSVAHVLHLIFEARRGDGERWSRCASLFQTPTPWLCTCGDCRGKWNGRRIPDWGQSQGGTTRVRRDASVLDRLAPGGR